MDGKETSANERTVDVKKQKKVGDESRHKSLYSTTFFILNRKDHSF
uniref:Uncharacterized protein n=1 Tax=Takifugu rubripes TaxID=31033 RepID=A0A674M9W6_TAKRU